MATGHGFVVCLYGLLDKKRRSTIEMIGYHQYLDAVARFIVKHPSRRKVIVLAGGVTSRSSQSEAASVQEYFSNKLREAFRKRGQPKPTFIILLEERSYNTPQNIHFGAALLVDERTYTATIIVDRPRRFTARIIAMHPKVMPTRQFEWNIESFPRRDIHPASTLQHQLFRTFRYFLYPSRIERELCAVTPASQRSNQRKEAKREPARPRQ